MKLNKLQVCKTMKFSAVATSRVHVVTTFDVLLTVHLSIFISVFKQLDAQNLFYKKFLFHASTCFEHM